MKETDVIKTKLKSQDKIIDYEDEYEDSYEDYDDDISMDFESDRVKSLEVNDKEWKLMPQVQQILTFQYY